ncbi:MAG TPA: hypothetical protein VNO84_12560 [Burkholderiaceae bacterium]|nr:hypothetical protein [Burkholderiaceae bacterium]
MSYTEGRGNATPPRTPPSLLTDGPAHEQETLRLLASLEGRSARRGASRRSHAVAALTVTLVAATIVWWAWPSSHTAAPAVANQEGSEDGSRAAATQLASPEPAVAVAPASSTAAIVDVMPLAALAAAPVAAASPSAPGEPAGASSAGAAASIPTRGANPSRVTGSQARRTERKQRTEQAERARGDTPPAVARQREADVDLLEALVAHVRGERPAPTPSKRAGEDASRP